MPTLRIALAQVNPTVGDLAGNAALVRGWTRRAADAGAHLVAFPEMMLTGYPVEDLVFRESFVAASPARAATQLAADLAADGLGDLPSWSATSTPTARPRSAPTPSPARGPPQRARAAARRRRSWPRYFKHHLPNYGVFDEDRYFVPGDTLTVVRLGGVDVALTICEDLWQAGGPFAVAGQAGVGLVVNINGSPYELNKDDVRLPLVRRRARRGRRHVAYVNMVGGQDELVFDGDSMVVAADGDAARPGAAVRRAPARPSTWTCRPATPATTAGAGERRRRDAASCAYRRRRAVPAPAEPAAAPAIAEPLDRRGRGLAGAGARPARLRRARTASARWSSGLSGGIDSARGRRDRRRRARARPGVRRRRCPASYSSEHSRDDAADLAKRTGLDYRVEPIAADGRRLPGATCRCPGWRWRTCRPGCAA